MIARLPRVLTVISIAGGLAALTATPAAGATLWNQFDNASANATVSQNFEAAFGAFDSELADDVAVPSGEKWKVKRVDVDGSYFNGTGPAASANVAFYRNSAGLPGTQTYSASAVVPSAGLDTGDFVIALPTAAKLGAGKKYWVSVQANLDFSPGGQWGWQDRTVQSGNAAAWRNPGNGFGTGCTSFAPRGATCGINPGSPDQVFKLIGKAIAVP